MNGVLNKVDPTEVSDWSVPLPRNTMSDRAPSGPFRISTSPTASSDIEGALRARFQVLASQWKRDTAHQSMLSSKVAHPAYLAIMRMGDSAIPLILEDLESEPDHWFWALHILTGEQPLPDDFSGTITDAARLWVAWGKQQGLLADAQQRTVWNLSQT